MSEKGEAAPVGGRTLGALLAVTALGAVLRLSALDGEGFWYDELRTLLASRKDLVPMIGERLVAGHPPLFFGLSWLLVHVVGESELLLRLPSALAGTAAVPVAYLVASGRGSRGVGLLGAGLVALSPAQLDLARVARPYAPLVLVALLSTAVLVRADGRPGKARERDVLLFGLLTLLALGLHASALLVLAAQLVFLSVRRRRRWRLVAAGLGALVLALACLGAVPVLVGVAVSAFGHDLLRVPRYFGASGVALLLLAARGVRTVGSSRAGRGERTALEPGGAVVAALLLGVSAAGCVLYFRYPLHPDWRAAAEVVRRDRERGEEVTVTSRFPSQEAVLGHYLGEPVDRFKAERASAVRPASPGLWIAVPSTPGTVFPDAPQEAIDRIAGRYRERGEHRVSGVVLIHLQGRKRDSEARGGASSQIPTSARGGGR